MSPQISVVLPTNRKDDALASAIDSILEQDFEDFEFLIVLDNLEISAQERPHYGGDDSRVRFLQSAGSGIEDALNTGWTEAKGEFIARMDSDDWSHPDRLSKQMEFIFETGAKIVGAQIQIVDSRGNCVRESRYPARIAKSKFLRPMRSLVAHPTMLIAREVLLESKGYRKKFPRAEDLDLWNRILAKYEIRNLEEPLLDYRKVEGYHPLLHVQLESSMAAVSTAPSIDGIEIPENIVTSVRKFSVHCFYRFVSSHTLPKRRYKASLSTLSDFRYWFGMLIYVYCHLRRGGKLTNSCSQSHK